MFLQNYDAKSDMFSMLSDMDIKIREVIMKSM